MNGVGVIVLLLAGLLAMPAVAAPQGPDAPSVLRVAPVPVAADQDGSAARPFGSPQAALDEARPGDVIAIAPGRYRGPIDSVRAGSAARPIVMRGAPGAVISGDGGGRLVEITHDHIHLRGLTLRRAEKLVWIEGARGVRLIGNVIAGAGGECVRVRAGAHANGIIGNRISDCGRRGFDASEGRKNGEGIYLGTAPEQLDDGEVDRTGGNIVRGNRISARAECVDVKERSAFNLIRANRCTGSRDRDSGGISARGPHTIITGNVIAGNAGAGIRLGGDEERDGIRAWVVGNRIHANAGYGLKVMRWPQFICANRVIDNAEGAVGGDHAAEVDLSCLR